MDTEIVLNKLRHKDGLKSVVLNAPDYLQKEFTSAGMDITPRRSEKYQFTILFVRDRSEVEQLTKPVIGVNEYDSIFWLAYPKGGSSIRSDLNRNILWELLKPYGYRPVSQVAVDDDWSALRFRPIERVKSRSQARALPDAGSNKEH